MVLLQTIRASGNCPSPPRKRLVVEAGVRDRPVQVLLRQRLPAVAPVIGHPPSVVEITLRTEDGRQVGKKLRALLREPGGQDRGHRAKLLGPHGDVLDGGPRRQGGVARSMRRDVINRDIRHLDKLKLQYPLDHLRRKGSGRMVWARLGEASLRESRGGGGVVFVAPAGGALEACEQLQGS